MPYGGTTNPGDVARLYVGDVNAAAPLLPDEAYIAFLAATGNNPGRAAVLACYALEGKYAQLADMSVEQERIAYSQIAKAYHDLGVRLAGSPQLTGFVAPLAGGMTDPTSGNDLIPFFTRQTP